MSKASFVPTQTEQPPRLSNPVTILGARVVPLHFQFAPVPSEIPAKDLGLPAGSKLQAPKWEEMVLPIDSFNTFGVTGVGGFLRVGKWVGAPNPPPPPGLE